jgi:hypothetical protein
MVCVEVMINFNVDLLPRIRIHVFALTAGPARPLCGEPKTVLKLN